MGVAENEYRDEVLNRGNFGAALSCAATSTTAKWSRPAIRITSTAPLNVGLLPAGRAADSLTYQYSIWSD